MEIKNCIQRQRQFQILKNELGQVLGSKALTEFHGLDKKTNNEIMTLEEVAQYLRKSPSWVYRNWKILGWQEARGFTFFPKKGEPL